MHISDPFEKYFISDSKMLRINYWIEISALKSLLGMFKNFQITT